MKQSFTMRRIRWPRRSPSISTAATTANDVIQAVNSDAVLGGYFSMRRRSARHIFDRYGGHRPDRPGRHRVTAGGSGTPLDQTSGLQVQVGDKSFVISLATAQTIEDVLNLINGSGAGVLAEINDEATGINLRSHDQWRRFFRRREWRNHRHAVGLRSLTLPLPWKI